MFLLFNAAFSSILLEAQDSIPTAGTAGIGLLYEELNELDDEHWVERYCVVFVPVFIAILILFPSIFPSKAKID